MSGQGFYGGVIVHRACGHKLYMKRVNLIFVNASSFLKIRDEKCLMLTEKQSI